MPCIGLGACLHPSRTPLQLLQRMRDRRGAQVNRLLSRVQKAISPPMRGVRVEVERDTPAGLDMCGLPRREQGRTR